ncbi:hypothetical protein M5C72_02845 [Companilactobacillus allii]|uniref:Uncharacterized protein n=1 Tax=Companilactobacillus allii TaxID=1847728 RepID=A0A1P8Q2N8_9LACO|nr:hypothetical protein [Companilactobacillus allii]APX72101.1 hypothetical protein BTM29_05770 [Companilactobacillus allii]USQ69193.1 hypothetical protein M5C72_02845 [Companilactobacillus allii]
MTKLFKGLNNIIFNVNKQVSSIAFDTLRITKSDNSSLKSHIVINSSYSNSKQKEKNAIKSDFDAIGKDLFKSLKQYEKSKFNGA